MAKKKLTVKTFSEQASELRFNIVGDIRKIVKKYGIDGKTLDAWNLTINERVKIRFITLDNNILKIELEDGKSYFQSWFTIEELADISSHMHFYYN